MKFGCLFVFSSVLQIWYVEVRISRSVSEGPFDFEITIVDYIFLDIRGHFEILVFEITRVYCISGPGCSKLTTSLVNVSLKFQTLNLIFANIFVENM